MKRKGFTLAEVLVTMMIVGVVASLTLPALNSNVKERANITRYKKSLAMMSNVGAITKASDKFDFSTATDTSTDDAIYDENGDLKQGLWYMFRAHGKVNVTATKQLNQGVGGRNRIVFNDGSVFDYLADPTANNSIIGWIDVDGINKGANRESKCDDENCTTGKKIYDRFYVTLRKEDAYPGGIKFDANGTPTVYSNKTQQTYAAQWAANQ